MAGKTQIGRMASLGQLTPEQRENTMWIFSRAIEKLSNTDLATIYQTFTSKEMDLLQSALQREMRLQTRRLAELAEEGRKAEEVASVRSASGIHPVGEVICTRVSP